MNDEKVIDLLSTIAMKLGTKVENLFQILTKQAKLDAFICFAQLAFLALLYIPLLVGWHYIIPKCVAVNPGGKYSFDQEWPTEVQVFVAFIVIATICLCIAIIVQVLDVIEKIFKNLMNPQAAALDKILYKLK